MVQILKEHIKKNIAAAARKEFISKGFKNASMRTIAKNANIPLSSIYSYFKSKDEIFVHILSPLLQTLDYIFLERESEVELEGSWVKNMQQWAEQLLQELTMKFRNEFFLLYFKSYGSSVENRCELYIESFAEKGVVYMQELTKIYPDMNTNISKFFLHSLGAQKFAVMGEIVSHKLTEQETKQFITDFVRYSCGGWQFLMK